MVSLRALLGDLEYQCIKGEIDLEIQDIIYDSRKAGKDTVFVCIKGNKLDSHDFIPEVLEKGVTVLIVDRDVEVEKDVSVIKVEDTRNALAVMSAAYFGHPAKEIITIGITGTKGKTTTSYMLQAILEKAGKKAGVIGTIGAFYDQVKIKTNLTTPESYELQKIFREMADAGCEYVIMEVSSQGLMLHRVAGFTFDYGIFTNISPDHIGDGEHASFDEYLYCKSLLFTQCRVGIINCDDEKWKEVTEDSTCEIRTFGFSESADLKGSNVEYVKEAGFLGIEFQTTGILNMRIKAGVIGKFNIYNALTAILTCSDFGIKEEEFAEAFYNIAIKGRVEAVKVSDKFHLFIDYAHNAVSTESLLITIKVYNPKRIICVFGAGGNRSKIRRYDMGEIAGKYADFSILTADNPRFEEVSDIIEDIKYGMKRSNGKYVEILDRKEAIRYSIEHAEEGDIILLIGKGHEDYQEIKGVKYHMDERELIADILKEIEYSKR
ncbi:MAG: UDP-N-acetylmuramoyl-L-alanyl-D-glutamate--2,6-diaminopimelate ligase [Clostridiales bacterium]|nr:UDP-N-acetylmuramoyl-L-alanyl-D-glutamate--2,6-diaminopimelate ligase [Clostridiales bacterium]